MIELQWGLTLSSEDRYGYSAKGAPDYQLQWGLTLSSEDSYVLGDRLLLDIESFNGASLFRVRIVPEDEWLTQLWDRLQWGLTLSSEDSSVPPPNAVSICWLQWGLTLSSEDRAFTQCNTTSRPPIPCLSHIIGLLL